MRHRIYELQQRSLTPQLAAGLASEYKINRIPYSRRFPATSWSAAEIPLRGASGSFNYGT